MPDKILGEFFNPKWIDQLEQQREAKGLTKEELAEELGVTTQALGYWNSHANNPGVKKREEISEKFNIKFEPIGIKELILTVIHCSDRQISSNAKRVFVLLILFDGKIPGAKIKIEELETVASKYRYKGNRIDDALDKLVKADLVVREQDTVWLNYDGCKALVVNKKVF